MIPRTSGGGRGELRRTAVLFACFAAAGHVPPLAQKTKKQPIVLGNPTEELQPRSD